MQIVINIPDRIYKITQNKRLNLIDGEILENAVKNGTPLPKGHGDLIDKKELLKQPIDIANYPSNYVRVAPTIIEADIDAEMTKKGV